MLTSKWPSLKQHLREQTRLYLLETMERAAWDKPKAWKLPGISQATAYRLLGKIQSKYALRRQRTASLQVRTGRLLAFFGIRTDNKYYNTWRFKQDGRRHLEAAHRSYVKMIREAHPDAGGSAQLASEINQAWDELKRRFAKRGVTLN